MAAKDPTEAQTQFAGAGSTINVRDLPANDAAAISDSVRWPLRDTRKKNDPPSAPDEGAEE